MAESLEEYLQRLLQQATEKQTPPRPTSKPPETILEAETVDLVEIPEPLHAHLRPLEAWHAPREEGRPADANAFGTEGASAAELRIGGDRPLGSLGATSTEADTAATHRAQTIVDEIVTLLHSPAGMQKAFVLSEILQRPQDRE
jgi:hypothetical protein